MLRQRSKTALVAHPWVGSGAEMTTRRLRSSPRQFSGVGEGGPLVLMHCLSPALTGSPRTQGCGQLSIRQALWTNDCTAARDDKFSACSASDHDVPPAFVTGTQTPARRISGSPDGPKQGEHQRLRRTKEWGTPSVASSESDGACAGSSATAESTGLPVRGAHPQPTVQVDRPGRRRLLQSRHRRLDTEVRTQHIQQFGPPLLEHPQPVQQWAQLPRQLALREVPQGMRHPRPQ